MRLVVVAVLSFAAFALAFAIHARGSAAVTQDYTTHIGVRVPPPEAGCLFVGGITTDAGKPLNVYACPPEVSDRRSRYPLSVQLSVVSDGPSSPLH